MASTTHETHPSTTTTADWHALAQQVLTGTPLDQQQAMQILTCPDDELLDLMSAAFRIRKQHFGKTVQLYFLMNAKSGLCPEDCSYCSQSKDSTAEIPKYNILSRDKLLDGARIAAERNAKTYCIVISARAPSERELTAVETIVPLIKEQYDLKICACLGLLSDDQAQRLCDAGVDRVNHNLNTSESNYENICTTHSYQDRLDTLHAVRRAGMEICSGGIIGMGEQNQDVIDMAFALRDLQADSIPLNFLNSIEGTRLENINTLTPQYCLKALAMYRFANPTTELRIAGGRELHLGSLQPLGLYAANSIFVGDYLTTEGQAPDADYQMIKDLGFEVTRNIE
jgi:biotin synthase|tara:strand:+ start:6922 stop:7944 length:1023 start_codon:yes stop_codon:yes gene_type:complete